jgi:hypothetical protein
VEHFLKKSSIISMSEAGIDAIGEECALIAHTEGLTAHEASVRMRLKNESVSDAQGKRFEGIDADDDLLGRLGIALGGEKIEIDLNKTKGFFDTLHNTLKSKAEKLQNDITEGSIDLGENVGIKVDDERIDIDLSKTKSFIENLGNTVAGLVQQIDGAVKDISKR